MHERGSLRKAAALLCLLLFFTGCAGDAAGSGGGENPSARQNGSRTEEGGTENETVAAGVISLPSGEKIEILASLSEEPVLSDISIEYDGNNVKQASQFIFAMDTEMTIQAYGNNCEEAVREAGEEIARIDRLLSVGHADSEIAVLNREGSAEVSEMTASLIRRAIEIGGLTEGRFDITVFPLMSIWGFTTGEFAVPSDEEIQALLPFLGTEKIRIGQEEGTGGASVILEPGTMLDLGGIAKGYTSDRLMEIFDGYHVDAGLVSLGGNVQTYGTKVSGSEWRVGIQDPEKNENCLGVVELHDKAVITSGGYERYFEESGIRYHHILDPSTGYPADSGLKSVTIISENGTLADGLSTALFIMGEERAEEFWKDHREEFDFILETEDDRILVSEGLEKSFSSDYDFEIIRN